MKISRCRCATQVPDGMSIRMLIVAAIIKGGAFPVYRPQLDQLSDSPLRLRTEPP